MGLAVDTVVGYAVNPSGTVTAPTMNSGDSLTIRNFPPGATARLCQMFRGGATSGLIRVRSPLLHDNVNGIQFYDSTSPSHHLFPRETGQLLQAQDALIGGITGGSAETDLMALGIYYSNLPGTQARLHSWGDIAASIVNIKPILVAVTSSGTAGVWADTVITTSENLLKANTDYAILGYTVDTALAVVGFKGADTGNLRISGPGYVTPEDTSDFFVKLSNDLNLPLIPVINAANAPGTYVSVAHNATSVASNVMLIAAQLAQPVTP